MRRYRALVSRITFFPSVWHYIRVPGTDLLRNRLFRFSARSGTGASQFANKTHTWLGAEREATRLQSCQRFASRGASDLSWPRKTLAEPSRVVGLLWFTCLEFRHALADDFNLRRLRRFERYFFLKLSTVSIPCLLHSAHPPNLRNR